MRRIRYGMYVSLDGYIAGPNGELDWHDIGEELHQYVNAEWETIDTHLYGRRMYEAMRYWETADADPSLTAYARRTAHLWQRAEHLVFSKTLTTVGRNARLVRDIDHEAIAALKAQPGGDMEVAGAELAAAFARLGLIDEYCAYVHPVILGGGTPMFPAPRERLALEIVETRTFSSGVVLMRYVPRNEP